MSGDASTEPPESDALRLERLPLDALTARALFELARLRVDVFVVEQRCPYPELDDLDLHPGTRHVLGYAAGELVACARTLAPPERGAAARIGRVAVRRTHRRRGLARALLDWTLAELERERPRGAVELGAQLAAEGLYASLGFERVSAAYLEDGIPHIEMRRQPPASPSSLSSSDASTSTPPATRSGRVR